MNNQALAIQSLRVEITEMMQMVLTQLNKAHDAALSMDMELAHEIISIEKKVNAMDINIDKACENILALYNPLAMDLRFVLAVLSINKELERIGDNAEAIAKYLLSGDISTPFSTEVLEEIEFKRMFETGISMVDDAIYSFINEDTKIAKWVFGKDITLNQINAKCPEILTKLIQQDPSQTGKYLYLFSIMKKLERVGDMAKNIAEETIFFVDAKIIRHKVDKYNEKRK